MKKNILYIIFFSVLFTSCAIYEPVQIQVLKKAGTSIDPEIFKVILINHGTYYKATLQISNIDSLRTSQYLNSLGNVLINSPRFELVQAPPYFIEKPSFNDRFQKLDWNLVSKICRDSSADAAIVLENFQLTYTDPVKFSYSPDYGIYTKLVMENTALWRIYVPDKKKIPFEYLMRDTLVWDANGSTEADVLSQLPDVESAIMQSCWYAGQRFGEYISPSWEAKRRYLVICEESDFQKALQYAQNNEWEKAIEIWKRYPYHKNKRLASFAAYNLAIASETLDHIDIALEWAAKSYLLRRNDFVEKYIELLEKRKQETEEVNSTNTIKNNE